jgi:selenoprotein W-related protein
MIESLTLVTGSKGIFDVEVDGEMLYSKHATGRHAEPGEVLGLFRDRYAQDVTPYGD